MRALELREDAALEELRLRAELSARGIGDRNGLACLPLRADYLREAQHTGAMVALYPPPELAAELALDDGEEPADLHVTLAFLGEAARLRNIPRIEQAVRRWAAECPPLEGEVSGVGQFVGGPKPVTYLSIDLPELPAQRERLIGFLERAGAPVSHDHGFTPHMTLDYARRRPKIGKPVPLRFSYVTVAVGDEQRRIPLGGKLTEEPLRERRVWIENYARTTKHGREEVSGYWRVIKGLQSLVNPRTPTSEVSVASGHTVYRSGDKFALHHPGGKRVDYLDDLDEVVRRIGASGTPDRSAPEQPKGVVFENGMSTAEIRKRFEEMDPDDHLYVFHATDRETAERFKAEGIDPSGKPRSLARQRYERGEAATYQPGAGLSAGLTVAPRVQDVGGYGRHQLAIRVQKKDIGISPEQRSLGAANPADALAVGDAEIHKRVPPDDVVEVTERGMDPSVIADVGRRIAAGGAEQPEPEPEALTGAAARAAALDRAGVDAQEQFEERTPHVLDEFERFRDLPSDEEYDARHEYGVTWEEPVLDDEGRPVRDENGKPKVEKRHYWRHPERKRMQEAFAQAMNEGVERKAEGPPEAVLTVGGPGNGKGTLKRMLADPASRERILAEVPEEAREVAREVLDLNPDGDNYVDGDPDEPRTRLPEWHAAQERNEEGEARLTGAAAAELTHEEASDITELAIAQAMEDDLPVVIDKVGGSKSWFKSTRTLLERGRHRTVLNFATAPPELAQERVREREERGVREQGFGRGVPPEIVRNGFRKAHAAWERMRELRDKEERYVPIAVFDMARSAAEGGPRLIYVRNADGVEKIISREAYEAFYARTEEAAAE